jgi:hypothetical protein
VPRISRIRYQHRYTEGVFYPAIAEELFWFIRGSTSAKDLQDKVA